MLTNLNYKTDKYKEKYTRNCNIQIKSVKKYVYFI